MKIKQIGKFVGASVVYILMTLTLITLIIMMFMAVMR